MYLYILSYLPCAVKFNGTFIGTASENYSIYPSEKGLFEFIPLCQGFAQTCFMWNNKPCDKQENVEIIDLYGGFLIIPRFKRQIISNFKQLFFKIAEFPNFEVKIEVFSENGTKISISQGKNKLTEAIPFSPSSLQLEKACLGGRNYLLAFLNDKKTAAFGFELESDKIKTVLKRECNGYEIKSSELLISENKNDILKHTVREIYDFSNGVILKKAELKRGKELYDLPEQLLPYAFFEELKLGKDVSDFLSPTIRPRAKQLKSFIGDFSVALPPPHFMPDNYVTLLYGDKAEYAAIKSSHGLIENLTLTSNGE